MIVALTAGAFLKLARSRIFQNLIDSFDGNISHWTVCSCLECFWTLMWWPKIFRSNHRKQKLQYSSRIKWRIY